MSETGDRLARLLSLVPYVVSRGVASISETAAEFGIGEDQLRKELEMLWLCGSSSGPEDLIDLLFDGDTVSVTYDGGLSRPFKLTSTEAMTLAVALRTLSDVPGASDGGAAVRALAKIETAAGQHVDIGGVEIRYTEQERWGSLVQHALDKHRAIDLTYYTASRDTSTRRTVDPVQVFTAENITYLEAWCRSAAAIRIFRLDRFTDAVLLDEPAMVPEDVTPSDVSSGVYRPAAEHLLAELLLEPGWRWVADYYPTETIAKAPPEYPDALRISLRIADPAWVAALVRRSGGGVRVLAPDWLAGSVLDEARAALRAYRS